MPTEVKKTREQLLNELEAAEHEMIYVRSQKKSTMKGYNEDIRDIQIKIKSILDNLEALKAGK